MPELLIRPAKPDDSEALLAIYAPYVLTTAITFEYEVPTVEAFATRIARTLERYPYLVAEDDGRVVGYAYAGHYSERAAYDWCCELSVYVAQDARRKGVGRRLYAALERDLAAMGICTLYACVAQPQTDDEYLTANSVRFHEHLGFVTIGRFNSSGYKFGRWYDVVWMERVIGDRTSPMPPITPYPQLPR